MKKIKSFFLIFAWVIALLYGCKKSQNEPSPSISNQTRVVVSTFAGYGNTGAVSGTGTDFRFPTGIAADASGNLYVVDELGNRIRKITSAGVVTTLAGSGSIGFSNDTGTAAMFKYPSDVAVDASGNIYVADWGNSLIRKITSDRTVSTFAGKANTSGAIDGNGTAAIFSQPNNLAIDANGNLYVTEGGNNNIRKITPNGDVTTLAGSRSAGNANGTGTAASFNYPTGIAVDISGNLYVADRDNNLIRKITSAGVVTTFAGSGSVGSTNGTGTSASFNKPEGLAVDSSGNVYVADRGNHLIRKITSGGIVTTLAGTGRYGSTNGSGTEASFNEPSGILIDKSGYLFITDSQNNLIRKIQILD